MWDERYSAKDYIYGTEPNEFLAAQCDLLSGKVLSIGEGEGRNAVFLATRGIEMQCIDGSKVGLEKAAALAASKGVQISTMVGDLAEFSPAPESFDGVISIFAHLPSSIRYRLYPLLIASLKPGGIFLMESYSLDQLGRETGGPKDADMLMSMDKIRTEFDGLEVVLLQEIERDVVEGTHHTGMASVVQFIGRKPI